MYRNTYLSLYGIKHYIEKIWWLGLEQKMYSICIKSFIHNISLQCHSYAEDEDTLWDMYDRGLLFKYKCPKQCSILEFFGKIDYWEPKYHTFTPNNTMIIHLRFQSPEVATVYEEYLIYDFNTLIGYIGGTLGMFIGFSFSGIIEMFIHFLKDFQIKSYHLQKSRYGFAITLDKIIPFRIPSDSNQITNGSPCLT